MAKEALYKSVPGAKEAVKVHIVDSRTYSAAYGHPVVQGAIMAKEGKSVKEILAYLRDWFDRVEILLGCYTLEYARKSGRIGAAAAFVGDMLGLRPVISMIDGTTKTLEKVRSEKNLITRIAATAAENAEDKGSFIVICAAEEQYGRELQAKIKKETGIEPPLYFAGASIPINAGPRIVAAVYLGKKRPQG
jgi:DegV family protein with EDD domain